MDATEQPVNRRAYVGPHYEKYVYTTGIKKLKHCVAPGRRGVASLFGVQFEWGIDAGEDEVAQVLDAAEAL